MILRDIVSIEKSINEYRLSMYELTKKNGLTDPYVIKISQQLDKKIIMMQKLICNS